MTLKEWKQRGKELFGTDPKSWRFVCPSCGNIQTPQDFINLKEDVSPETAYFSCLGRWTGHMDAHMFPKDGGPCNYAGGGLLGLNPIPVIAEGKVLHVFRFDESEKEKVDEKEETKL